MQEKVEEPKKSLEKAEEVMEIPEQKDEPSNDVEEDLFEGEPKEASAVNDDNQDI